MVAVVEGDRRTGARARERLD